MNWLNLAQNYNQNPMSIKTTIVLLLSFIFYQQTYSQDNSEVLKTIKTLCSKKMRGRGYSFDGDKHADKFISKKLNKMGLTPSHHGFTFSTNTFENEMEIIYNKQKLIAGETFIVSPNSPSIKGKFPIKLYKASDDLQKLITQIQANPVSQICVFNEKDILELSRESQSEFYGFIKYLQDSKESICKAILIQNCKKLTFSASQTQTNKALIKTTHNHLSSEFKLEVNIKATLKKNYRSQNIFTKIEGEKTDSFYVFTAHYDHLGSFGNKAYFPGANDNASGTAFLLELAEYYSVHKPKYSIYFIFFSGEEIGLLGSKAFVKDEVINIKRIKFLLNFDLLGTGEDGIQIVNSSIYKKEYALLDSINTKGNYLSQLKRRGEACNSDHCPFHSKGAKSFFIYTLGGIQAYHDVFDIPETLPLTEFKDVQLLIKEFISKNP